MRIIKGNFRAKAINPPKKIKARPTTSIAKENLFNILENNFGVDFEEINVLDLFSGTGSISYEFISRGAKSLIAVELDYMHFSFIKKYFAEMSAQTSKVVKADAYRFLKVCKKKFNLVFADPPYNNSKIDTLADEIFNVDILEENAIVVIEHSELVDYSKNKYYLQTKKYGKVHFSFFQKTQE
jgi:16S rRNA (guanine(966)-N(2))-methyltransferase RsmD